MSYYDTGNTELVSRQGYSGLGFSISGLAKGALDFYGKTQQQAGQAAAYKEMAMQKAAAAAPKPSAMPSWLLPVGIGGAALLLLVMLKKR
jgi:hypothetical protein